MGIFSIRLVVLPPARVFATQYGSHFGIMGGRGSIRGASGKVLGFAGLGLPDLLGGLSLVGLHWHSASKHACMYVCMQWMYVLYCMYVSMYVYMCVCMCLWPNGIEARLGESFKSRGI